MAIDVSIPVPPPPTEARIQYLIIDQGLYSPDGSGHFSAPPGAKIVLRACAPLKNPDGTPRLNAFGEPTYSDGRYVCEVKLAAADLATDPQIMSLWSQLMAAAYAKAQAALPAQIEAGTAAWVEVGFPPIA